MSDMDLQKFHQLCSVSVIVEEDGSNPVLCVSAEVRDSEGEHHELKRCVALNPLIEMLADKIRLYHDQLHAKMEVSGDYEPFIAPILPPGQDPLEIQGWADSIRKTARHLGESKAVKTLYHDIKRTKKYTKRGTKWAKDHRGAVAKLAANSGIPGASALMQTSFKVYDALKAAKSGNRDALEALHKIKALAESGDPKAIHAYETAQNMNNMMKAKESGTSVSGETPWHHTDIMDTEVSGWLYNRPYRTNLQVLADAATGKFPTVSMAIREGWHDGFNFIANMKRKNISPLGF